MAKEWPLLVKSPVKMSLFQLKYEMVNVKLDDFLKCDKDIRTILPNRSDVIEANINVPKTNISLGTSKIIGTSNAKMANYTYFDVEQKKKFIIAEGTLTYIVEDKYSSWADFEKEISVLLQKCEPILINCIVNRLSIRFINQFVFENFDDPTEYFKTLISSSEDQVSIPYPLIKYGFKLTLDVKENTYAIVNQNLDRVRDKYVYIFDIDVLNRTDLMFENTTIVSVIQELREIKNNIFFSNITEKLIALCN